MTEQHGAEEWGRSALRSLRGRVVREQAVGILRSWQRCSGREARRSLADGAHGAGRVGEARAAARVVAILESDARGRTDPGWN